MELVDVLDSKSSGATRAGSTPAASIFPGRLAQLGEHLPYKQGVVGSSPASSIDFISYIEQPSGCFFFAFSYLPFPFSTVHGANTNPRRKVVFTVLIEINQRL